MRWEDDKRAWANIAWHEYLPLLKLIRLSGWKNIRQLEFFLSVLVAAFPTHYSLCFFVVWSQINYSLRIAIRANYNNLLFVGDLQSLEICVRAIPTLHSQSFFHNVYPNVNIALNIPTKNIKLDAIISRRL